MSISKIKAIVGIEYYEISDKFIYNLRMNHPRPEQAFDYLPKYTINTNKEGNNEIVGADWFLQFAGTFENTTENPTHLMFNIETLDATLKEELSNAGIEEIFKGIDFKEILKNFTPESENNLEKFIFSHCNYIIVETTYDASYDHEGGYDCDVYFDIVGYLDDNMNTIYFKN
jgi:hypothetical protein